MTGYCENVLEKLDPSIYDFKNQNCIQIINWFTKTSIYNNNNKKNKKHLFISEQTLAFNFKTVYNKTTYL